MRQRRETQQQTIAAVTCLSVDSRQMSVICDAHAVQVATLQHQVQELQASRDAQDLELGRLHSEAMSLAAASGGMEQQRHEDAARQAQALEAAEARARELTAALARAQAERDAAQGRAEGVSAQTGADASALRQQLQVALDGRAALARDLSAAQAKLQQLQHQLAAATASGGGGAQGGGAQGSGGAWAQGGGGGGAQGAGGAWAQGGGGAGAPGGGWGRAATPLGTPAPSVAGAPTWNAGVGGGFGGDAGGPGGRGGQDGGGGGGGVGNGFAGAGASVGLRVVRGGGAGGGDGDGALEALQEKIDRLQAQLKEEQAKRRQAERDFLDLMESIEQADLAGPQGRTPGNGRDGAAGLASKRLGEMQVGHGRLVWVVRVVSDVSCVGVPCAGGGAWSVSALDTLWTRQRGNKPSNGG